MSDQLDIFTSSEPSPLAPVHRGVTPEAAPEADPAGGSDICSCGSTINVMYGMCYVCFAEWKREDDAA